jgi:hypothetical protein
MNNSKVNICDLTEYELANFVNELSLDNNPEYSNTIFKKIKNKQNKTVIFNSDWIEPKYFSLYCYNNTEKLSNDDFFILKNNNSTYAYLKKFLELFISSNQNNSNNTVFPTNKLFGECIKVKINYDKMQYFSQFNNELIKLNIKKDNHSDIRNLLKGKKIKIEFSISVSVNSKDNNYMILNISRIVCEFEKKLEKYIKNENSKIITNEKNKKIDMDNNLKNNLNNSTRFYNKKYSKKSIEISDKKIIDIILNN